MTPPVLEVGDVVGGAWRLDGVIRRGASGTVFLATDLKLGRKVAIKALTSERLDPESLQRIAREGAVLAQVDHPNIVTLHRVGQQGGVPYLVMQHVEGRSLADLVLERGGLPPAGVLAIARQIASALEHLHERGLMHRDLKPANVLVGTGGHVRLVDLGIARPRASRLTRTGVVHGTPGYMAPEMILGETELDGRADIYAFGAVLFELLTGTLPFAGYEADALLRAHLSLPRPRATDLRPSLPEPVSDVLQRAMAVSPAERYAHAGDLIADLEEALRPLLQERTRVSLPPARAPSSAAVAPPRAPMTRGPEPADPDQVTAPRTPLRRPASNSPAPSAPPSADTEAITAPRTPLVRGPVPAADAPTPPVQRPLPRPHATGQRPVAAPTRRLAPMDGGLRPWWRRRDVQLGGAALLLLLVLTVGALLWPDGASGPPPPEPLPITVVGMDVPPPPPAPGGPADDPITHELTSQELEKRREAVRTVVAPKRPTLRRGGPVVPPMKLSRRIRGTTRRTGQADVLLIATYDEEPVRAQVEIDGVWRGATPLVVTLSAGSHRIRIDYPKSEVTEFVTDFDGGREVRLEVELRTPAEAKARRNRDAPYARKHHHRH